VRGPSGLAARGGRQLAASGGERAVSEGDGSSIEAAPSPGSSLTTISVDGAVYLPLGTNVEVVVGSYPPFLEFRIFTHCICN